MRSIAGVLAVALTLSCSTKSKAEVTESAMGDRQRRLEIMEATLRVLDQHPDYVDEFFVLALRHHPTLDRFLANTAVAVADKDRAERVARHLVMHPPGLRRVMIETLDAARNRPAAQAAIVDAIQARAEIAADFLVDHPEQLATVSKAIVEQAMEDPDTKDKMTELVKEIAD
ncbi:MAG: hypothetical protein JWP01_2234 [Myxococcales bacterium]|jgi:hypothetical protein|nr:hypothetical protein [Myxococcales bacterium]